MMDNLDQFVFGFISLSPMLFGQLIGYTLDLHALMLAPVMAIALVCQMMAVSQKDTLTTITMVKHVHVTVDMLHQIVIF